MSEDRKKLDTIIGLATIGSSVVGVVSLIAAVLALASGEYLGMGACLMAAALSLGLLANAVLRA
jgi:hypothetical protein